MKPSNITRVISLLINELHIPVTQQSIEEEIARHPSYQSMLAISELLDNWQIPNAAYKLTFEELMGTEIPMPLIAHFKKNFVLVTDRNKENITLYNGDGKKEWLSLTEFKNLYMGSILIAEKDEESGEVDYALKHRKERLDNLRIPFVVAGAGFVFLALILLSPSYTAAFSWPLGLLTLFKAAGLITTILLLVQSIDANNPLIQKLCGGDNNKDCNAILSSKAATVTEELSWSEAGFFYFAGTWLAMLFNPNNISLMQLLAILNIISLPYTFYSIYYQWRIAKQWCIFCCTVQALLWLEFFAFLPYMLHGLQTPAVTDAARVLAAMALPILAWIFVKPYLQLSKQIDPLKQQLRQFKYNTDLFRKVLDNGVQYTLPDEEDSLIIGNREAEQVITMVSNPYCQPCAKAHKKLDKWLSSREDIKLQVVFSVSTTDENNKKTKVASHLMSLQHGRDDVSLKKALDDWYEQKQKNYEAWSKEHPVTVIIDNTEALEKNKQWCKTTEIRATPTIFINGRKLPKPYQTEDIKYFM
jgi:protein-disulfide isomerase/uncharacterized membrane protein